MLRDLRFAVRQLLKAPGFSAVAVLTLAVAIGANSAVLALVDGVVLRPVVPLRPHEVVEVFTAWKDAEREYRPFSYQEFQTVRQGGGPFVDVAAMEFRLVGVGEGEVRRRSFAAVVSESFFALAGVQPVRGRFFEAAECRPGADLRVVVASHALWRKTGARADFVGSTLRVNGRSYKVVGVAPRGFSGVHAIFAPELWLPLGVHEQLRASVGEGAAQALSSPRTHALGLIARLQPGLTLDTARPGLAPLARQLTEVQPGEGARGRRERDLQIQVPPRFSITISPTDPTPTALIAVLLAVMAAVVLLIASLNLANMLLARGAARAREIAVRRALGASRGRIVRQLLAEGLLLALLGGAAGLVLSAWGNDLLVAAIGSVYASITAVTVLDVSPDGRVIAATLVLCLLATLAFSLGPALAASRTDLVGDLKQDPGDPARTGRLHRFFAPRHLLVMAQMALSLALLFGAGLFLRGALRAAALDPGFRPAGTLVTEMDFTVGSAAPTAAARSMAAALARARALPEVSAAALGTQLPYGEGGATRRVERSDQAGSDGRAAVSLIYSAISSRYFAAVGVPVLRGRDFTAGEADTVHEAPVAILDEAAAAIFFPGGQAVGQHVRLPRTPSDETPSADLEVVGVVGKHRQQVFGGIRPRIFVPLAAVPDDSVFLYTRLAGADRADARRTIPRLREALRSDPDLPVLAVSPFVDLVDRNVGLWLLRLAAVLFGVLGGIALLLAVVGVYAVKAYAVSRRTREIGIRMALGAQARDVLSLVLTQGALQTLLALAVGAALAMATGRVLARVLFQVSPADPLALLAASLALAVAALAACLLPAHRATRVSPMSALRGE